MQKNTDKNKTTQKIIYALMLILILAPAILFSTPKQAHAQLLPVQPVAEVGPWGTFMHILTGTNTASTLTNTPSTLTNTGLHIKDFATAILQQLVTTVERQLLKAMTQSTVNWINSGFHGSPLFVQNPASFFNDIAKNSIESMVNQFGYNPNQYPFGESFALNIINGYKQTLANNAQYSLSKVINDPTLLNNYRNNFNVGGWNGFLINTQYPQNNYLGFNMMATNALAQQLQGTTQNVAQTVRTQLNQAQGFLSPKTCPSNPYYNNGINEFSPPVFTPAKYNFQTTIPQTIMVDAAGNPTTNPADAITTQENPAYDAALSAYNASFTQNQSNAQDAFNALNTCPGGLKVSTPGSVAANQIMTALGTSFQQSVLGSMVTNSISAILDTLINHFIGQGLTGLANVINPPPSVDNFSYEGQTLTGSTTTNPTNALTISQNATTTVGKTTSVTISGGTAPYTISTQPDSSIAIATISGSTITVTGIGAGTTSVSILDSSSPIQSATAQITINTSLAINFDNPTPINITLDAGNTTNINLSGGTGPYSVTTQPDSSIAGALLSSENTLSVVSIGAGQSSFVVQDSSGKSVTVTITVNSPSNSDLTASPQGVSISTGNITTVTLSGGTPPYSLQNQPDSTVAQGIISDTTLNVIGVGSGTTSFVVQDSSFPIKTVTIGVTGTGGAGGGTGTPPVTAGLGTCNYPPTGGQVGSTTPNTAQDTCTSGGGTWTANLSTDQQNVSLNFVGGKATVNISGGDGNYSIRGYPDPSIAGASISGSTLTITSAANKAGSTQATVQDSSGQSAIVSVTVNNPILSVAQNISVAINGSVTRTISGGDGNYSIEGYPNSAIASASIPLGSSYMTITGNGAGTTQVTVQDGSGQSVIINITVSGLLATPSSAEVAVNGSATIQISGGDAYYGSDSIAVPPNGAIATAQIYENKLTITGKGVGTTKVTVQDGSSKLNVVVNITVGGVGTQ